jgi:hypothetical protein
LASEAAIAVRFMPVMLILGSFPRRQGHATDWKPGMVKCSQRARNHERSGIAMHDAAYLPGKEDFETLGTRVAERLSPRAWRRSAFAVRELRIQ